MKTRKQLKRFALFGTILVYMAARPVVGEGLDAMVWSVLVARAGAFDPALLDVAFVGDDDGDVAEEGIGFEARRQVVGEAIDDVEG